MGLLLLLHAVKVPARVQGGSVTACCLLWRLSSSLRLLLLLHTVEVFATVGEEQPAAGIRGCFPYHAYGYCFMLLKSLYGRLLAFSYTDLCSLSTSQGVCHVRRAAYFYIKKGEAASRSCQYCRPFGDCQLHSHQCQSSTMVVM